MAYLVLGGVSSAYMTEYLIGGGVDRETMQVGLVDEQHDQALVASTIVPFAARYECQAALQDLLVSLSPLTAALDARPPHLRQSVVNPCIAALPDIARQSPITITLGKGQRIETLSRSRQVPPRPRGLFPSRAL